MNNKERFTNRVDTYVKYRPRYPEEAIDYLYSTVGLTASSLIADVGAGTGIFSEQLLARGSHVIAVEPNKAMREAAIQAIGDNPMYEFSAGSAEATGLQDHSIEFITCAQAFHWFDRPAAQAEFQRILKPDGKVVLIWNSRLTSGSPFLEQYDQLLRMLGSDYEKINHKNIDKTILLSFFKEGQLQEARFTNRQAFDYEGLLGRLLSSSYTPTAENPLYEPMIAELRQIFERNEQNGTVFFDYETEVFWGEV